MANDKTLESIITALLNVLKMTTSLTEKHTALTEKIEKLTTSQHHQVNEVLKLTRTFDDMSKTLQELLNDTSAEEFIHSIEMENKRRDEILSQKLDKAKPIDYTSLFKQLTEATSALSDIVQSTLTKQNDLLNEANARLQTLELRVGALSKEDTSQDVSLLIQELEMIQNQNAE